MLWATNAWKGLCLKVFLVHLPSKRARSILWTCHPKGISVNKGGCVNQQDRRYNGSLVSLALTFGTDPRFHSVQRRTSALLRLSYRVPRVKLFYSLSCHVKWLLCGAGSQKFVPRIIWSAGLDQGGFQWRRCLLCELN